ncbi:MAG TPA: ribonuclease J [Blastocatellia bacterium]|nr:ribonuclease J [Blastocatellia bacterium]
MSEQTVELIPLGGFGEFGMNMLALRYGEEIIVIDAGMTFPDESLHGVDVVIPDLRFIEENASRIKALLLTHAHEDHIGAVPFFLKVANVPVYGSRFTLAVLEHKLIEHGLIADVECRMVEPGDFVETGPFDIEFIGAAHSTIDCFALAITTPVGVIIHATDFKLDEEPVIGEPTDLRRLRQYGDRGVLALLADSTNVERSGRTPSERAVLPVLEEIFERAPGRIIVSCFASSIHRIQLILDLAHDYGCRVALVGPTMTRMVETAINERYLDVPPGLLISPADVNRLPPDKVVMLVTGCQGEPMAALARMATGSYKQLRIQPGDTVILSARIIPGNERAIARLIDHIYRRGATVIDESVKMVHVSGHPYQGDLKLLYEAVRPRVLIPIHGDFRRLSRHKEFACASGFAPEQVIVAENGQVIALSQSGARLTGETIPVGRTFIDEAGFEEIEEFIIRDRRHLAEDGFILPIVVINKTTGELEAIPEIISRGFIASDDGEGLLDQARDLVQQTVTSADPDEKTDWAVMKEKIRLELKRFIVKQTERHPMIIPVIIEI